jgi:uncharacterized membrane protein (TIGR02234 family)
VTTITGETHQPAAAAPRARARREYALGLILGVVGAGLVVLSGRPAWARVRTPAPPPLHASTVTVSGQDLIPLAGALGLAALATLAAVIATRGLARRLTGVLLAAFGVAAGVAVSLPITTAAVLAAARVTTVSQAGSATAGGAGVSPGTVPNGTTPGVTATGHVTMLAALWRPAAVVGALIIVVAGLLVAWRGGQWPAMSSRYTRRPEPDREEPADSASLWEALSRGADPTERAEPAVQPADRAGQNGGAGGSHGPD